MKKTLLTLTALAFCAGAFAQPMTSVQQLAASEQPRLLETLKTLVEIETGSTNRAGLDKLSALVGERLKALGADVQYIEPSAADVYRMEDTPENPAEIGRIVRATFKGTGTKKILMIAHMDTVYPAGMLSQQPWRIEGNKAFGLGIADDKQGVALLLHTAAMLKALNVREYGTLTILINGDEEISSPAARKLLARAGAEHDAVMSFEASRVDSDKVSLATSGIALAALTVRGLASHAGSAPERGVNALYEMSHQLLQLRDLSVPQSGLKVNWTVAKAGLVRNMIPPGAVAWADIRLLKVSDLAGLEARINERIKNKLLPQSVVEVKIENRRPPLEATPASRALAAHAQRIYKEIGKELVVDAEAEGGGTDAAFAALETKAPVVERFGLQGFGAHSSNAEYVMIDSIQPRLYLATRMVMDLAQGKTR
ncbi:MAG: M20/M25/M40 family metallo-hydrolase [Burkholderiales bacterium]|nr:M20/M25/M40 family metallo-hydrolase [Burkholderiales bacterium]